MSVKYTSNKDKVLKEMDKRLKDNLESAAKLLVSELKKNTSGTGGPSQHGSFPAKDTGDLSSSFQYNIDGLTLTVGSTDKKAEWLERGTSKMAPRPFFKKTFDLIESRLKTLMGKK